MKDHGTASRRARNGIDKSRERRRTRRRASGAARACWLILDPVYSGKALFGLAQLAEKPRRVLFVHTGGLPGLLAENAHFG